MQTHIVTLVLLATGWLPALARAQWEPVAAPGKPVSVLGARAGALFATVGVASDDPVAVIYRSEDLGASWSPVSDIPSGTQIRFITELGEIMFAGGGGGQPSLYRSLDHGIHWTSAIGGLPAMGVVNGVAELNGRHFVALGMPQLNDFVGGIYQSDDRGASWVASGYSGAGVTSLLATPDGMLASYYSLWSFCGGIKRSVDGGINWEEAGTSTPACPFAESIQSGNQSIYLTAASLVFEADEEELIFETRMEGLPDSSVIRDLIVVDQRLVLATDRGLFTSIPDPILWEEVNDGFTEWVDVLDLAFLDGMLFAGAADGIWRRSFADLVTSVGIEGERPRESPVMLSAYPEPSSGSVTWHLELNQGGPVSLALYDVLGRKVADVYSGWLPAGSHRLPWPADALAGGLYLGRLDAFGEMRTVVVTFLR